MGMADSVTRQVLVAVFGQPRRGASTCRWGIPTRRFVVSISVRQFAIGLALITLVSVGPPLSAIDAFQPPANSVEAFIQATVSNGIVAGPELRRREWTDLRRLYEAARYARLWTDMDGRPDRNAREALTLLAQAGADGLETTEYDLERLVELAAALHDEVPPADDVAAFDTALSAAVLRYMRHLHLGRIDPEALGFRLRIPAEPHDFVALLQGAIAQRRVAAMAVALTPDLMQYRVLRDTLTRYRALAADPALGVTPTFPRVLRPGDPFPDLPALRRLLVALGDLEWDASMRPGEAIYDEPLVGAVKRFQIRHGLEADGVLGRATQAALRVPLTSRVLQIEFALERLRWLPDATDSRTLALNIPMFHLWTWETAASESRPALDMRAIVGRAISSETPVFVAEMHAVIFRPYWNVPSSILRSEILPLLASDPDYLTRHDMEIVGGFGGAIKSSEVTPESLALLRQGALRVRQRPGPRNALGLVKFEFPNAENVYLHGTPAQELFTRTRRDFSHGCVRVEDPIALAEWVLGDQPEWTRDRILAATRSSRSEAVQLTRPVRVVLFYTTAIIRPDDGALHFAEDIYGHDAALDRALARTGAAR